MNPTIAELREDVAIARAQLHAILFDRAASSWDRAADAYAALYLRLLGLPAEAPAAAR